MENFYKSLTEESRNNLIAGWEKYLFGHVEFTIEEIKRLRDTK